MDFKVAIMHSLNIKVSNIEYFKVEQEASTNVNMKASIDVSIEGSANANMEASIKVDMGASTADKVINTVTIKAKACYLALLIVKSFTMEVMNTAS